MPDPTYTIPEHFEKRYAMTFAQEVQQSVSKFSPFLDADSQWTGKQFVYRDLSKTNWVVNNSRGGTTPTRESTASFRSVFSDKLEPEEGIIFPDWDDELLDRVSSPKSAEMEAMKMGFERALDDLTISRLFSDVYVGTEANGHTTAKAFPTANILPVNYGTPVAPTAGSNQPLTPWKIIRAKKMIEMADVDLDREELLLAISPEEVEDLIYYVSTAPNELWATIVGDWLKAYQSGNTLAKLMGCTVIRSNRLTVSSGIRTCALYCRSAFVRSAYMDVKSSFDKLPREKHAMQLWSSARVGIGRRRDEGVIQIPCAH